MKIQKRLPVNVLTILGDTSYSKSVLRILVARYRQVIYVTMGVQSKCMKVEFFRNGARIWQKSVSYRLPGGKFLSWVLTPFSVLVGYLAPFFLAFWAVRKLKLKFSVGIGEFYHGFASVFLLKKMGYVKKTVYWVSDWFPYQPLGKIKFTSFLINSLAFPFLDRFSAQKADASWNFTQRIIEARHQRWLTGTLFAPEEVLCLPLTLRTKEQSSVEVVSDPRVGFLGVPRKGQGIELMIRAVAVLKKQGKPVIFEVVGSSDYLASLKELVRKLEIQELVNFHGYIKNEEDIVKIIERCGCSVALFEASKDNYTYYTWPSKVGFYLECGNPVVITPSAAVAADVERLGLGLVVQGDVKEVVRAVSSLLFDQNLQAEYRANALRYVQARATGRDLEKLIGKLL